MYVALGVLAVLGGGYYMQVKNRAADTARHSVAGAQTELPSLALSEEQTAKITKIVIQKPAGEGEKASPAQEVTLVKEGETWKLQAPVSALANQKNIESLLKNLNKLAVKEQIGKNKDSYAQYDVSDDKAVHATFYEGDRVVRALWAGKSGGRGQMARLDGSDGVYIIDGYSSFLYSRDVKGWRDLAIFEVDQEEVTKITVDNENGSFVFEKEKAKDSGADKPEGDKASWSGKFKAKKAGSAGAIKEFESKKVDDLLNAYKKLNASDFGDGKSLAETGLDAPKAKVTFSAGAKEVVLELGGNAEGSARWAKVPGNDQIYSISSWAADWATAAESKFQKAKEGEEPPAGPPSGMPPGMEMMGMPPGMPGGHP
jgi:hypothetical protein